jgi:hypothetical protein
MTKTRIYLYKYRGNRDLKICSNDKCFVAFDTFFAYIFEDNGLKIDLIVMLMKI